MRERVGQYFLHYCCFTVTRLKQELYVFGTQWEGLSHLYWFDMLHYAPLLSSYDTVGYAQLTTNRKTMLTSPMHINTTRSQRRGNISK